MTVVITDNDKKAHELIAQLLGRPGQVRLTVTRQDNGIKIVEEDAYASVALRDKLDELAEVLFRSGEGAVYKNFIGIVEKPLLERVLQSCEGNQLKAARILGINRNTMRAKIRKLGIDVIRYR